MVNSLYLRHTPWLILNKLLFGIFALAGGVVIFFFLPNESFLALLGGIGILLLPYRSLFYLTDACAVVGEVRFGPVDSTAAGPTATVTTGIAASAGVERSTASMGRPSFRIMASYGQLPLDLNFEVVI
ncbi:hypothetical protein N7536_006084 [Penicillium majusculum]|nr:hypothetical protein N7536_006084 [Penicillium majusculum]